MGCDIKVEEMLCFTPKGEMEMVYSRAKVINIEWGLGKGMGEEQDNLNQRH